MKSIATQLLIFVRHRPGRRNVKVLLRFLAVLTALVAAYSVAFHYLMAYEDRYFSWVSGLYWTLTVMSTLGFGDITFHSDLGRAFSILVLVSGTLFLLILLPFTFIQFFYAPWTEAKAAARAPRRLAEQTAGHVVLAGRGPVVDDLIERFDQFAQAYVLLAGDTDEALRLHDAGRATMIGEADDIDTYRRCRADAAALVIALGDDVANTNAAFVARQAAPVTPILTSARAASAATIQRLAGATRVLEFGELMGESLARRTIGGDAVSHVVGEPVGNGQGNGEKRDAQAKLLIAEANASRTPLVGRTLRENRLRDLGPSVLGVWDRGRFDLAAPETVVGEHAVLLLAGTRGQLDAYDEAFVIYNVSGEPALVVGGGTVGCATARALARRGIGCVLIERYEGTVDPADLPEGCRLVVGDAADPRVLMDAGLADASAALVTTSDDATNIYLTIQVRHLRPDVQILARAERDRSVETLHRAGADVTMSMASLGVAQVLRYTRRADIVPVAEGLNVIRLPVPASLAGRRIGDLDVRKASGATIVALADDEGTRVNPSPDERLTAGADLLFIGTAETERRFIEAYCR